MLVRIEKLLPAAQLAQARELLTNARFVDGKFSAGAAAARVKRNEELDPQTGNFARLNELTMAQLVRHPMYRAATIPLHFAARRYARERSSRAYGEHLDDPIMGADGVLYRADVAVTIFLNEPADYDGGELAIRTAFGEQTVKLPAGDAVLYPASSLHRVREVTRGERLVAVTWVQSLVREPARRELLYDLYQAREALLARAPAADETARVSAAYVNLVRMWSEL